MQRSDRIAASIDDSAARRRPRRLRVLRTDLTVAQILRWADAHKKRTGSWPKKDSGPVADALGETWAAIHLALRRGGRGLDTRTTLARLLAEQRGVRNHLQLPPLSADQILLWADEFHAEHGRWPTGQDGPVESAVGETWYNLNAILCQGGRGLAGGSSLARLLAEARGARNRKGLPPLTLLQILTWADIHKKRTGQWPHKDSGQIVEAPAERWSAVDAALHAGCRGLPAGMSLAKVLEEYRGMRNRKHLAPLRPSQIRAWAVAYRKREGRWPREKSGAIPEAPGETWAGVNAALREGLRGLPGGTTLFRFLS